MPCEENRKLISRTLDGERGELQSDRISAGLQASSTLANRLGHPGPDIRPCIARLLETSRTKGGYPDRSTAAVIIASELKRIGKTYEYAATVLATWNSKHDPPLRQSELAKAVRNAYEKDYNYGCQNAVLKLFCLGPETCPFARRLVARKRLNDLVFFDYDWPGHLSNLQVLIYQVALPYLEKVRKVGRGGVVFASHREIARSCGISARRVGENLTKLNELGLIEYRPGTPRVWERAASEIRRTFPIPQPDLTNINRVQRMS